MRESIALLIMLAIFPSLASAQQTDKRSRLSVTANGEAVITVELTRRRSTRGRYPGEKRSPAAKENAEKLARVMSEVASFSVRATRSKPPVTRSIPTIVIPRAANRKSSATRRPNVLYIKTGALDNVGTIDAAMQSGANTIQRLLFTLKDEHSAQLQALRSRVDQGQSKSRGNGQCPRPQNRQGPLRYRR